MILKANSKLEEEKPIRIKNKFVGINFPTNLHSYLCLYAVAKGLTKSLVIKQKMDQWSKTLKMSDPEEDLLKELVHRVTIEWKALRIKKPYANFEDFKKELRIELHKKGIDDPYIQKIMRRIDGAQ